jgi:hypothetical protein
VVFGSAVFFHSGKVVVKEKLDQNVICHSYVIM